MARSTAKIALTLVGSAALLGCCCVSCVDVRDEQAKDANGNALRDQRGHVVHHRRYYYRPWWPWWHGGGYYGGYGPFWTSTRSYSPSYGGGSLGRTTGGGTSGGGRSTSGATSRGGFGGSGHAVGS